MEDVYEEIIMKKYKTAVSQMRLRWLGIGYALGSLFVFVPLSQIKFSSPPYIILLGRISAGVGLLLIILSMVRAVQVSRWPVLLIQARILEKRQATKIAVRFYLRLQPLQAELFEKKRLVPYYQSLEPELDYTLSPSSMSLFYESEEGEIAKFICVPKSKQILDRI